MTIERTAVFALSLILAATATWAEGARLSLSCRASDGAQMDFTIAPVAVDGSGAGQIALTHDTATNAGFAASFLGPWSWQTKALRQTLLIDGQSESGTLFALLHSLPLDGLTRGILTPLTCETDI